MRICQFARNNARLVDVQEQLTKKEVYTPHDLVLHITAYRKSFNYSAKKINYSRHDIIIMYDEKVNLYLLFGEKCLLALTLERRCNYIHGFLTLLASYLIFSTINFMHTFSFGPCM